MDLVTRPVERSDLDDVDRICRVAFGTFLEVPDPEEFFGDRELVRTRFHAAPDCVIAAELDGRIVGSNFVTRWGSFGFFGPLTVTPELWNRGVAQRLLEPTIEMLEKWGCTLAGLFTFSHSEKHVGLYQKFGFWPRFLTAALSKDIAGSSASGGFTAFSSLGPGEKAQALEACRATTDAIYSGLDLSREIGAVDSQSLGDTVVLFDGSQAAAFAVCHAGAGTEAGGGSCYVKFACVRPGAEAQRNFERLLRACEAFGIERGAGELTAGVNTARHEAYRTMLESGFRTQMLGVAMHRPNAPGFSREGVYVLDDWR